MGTIIFDIETGTNESAENFMPEFKPPRIKRDGGTYSGDKTVEEQEYEWLEKCPLDAITGKVIVVGILEDTEGFVGFEYFWGTEKETLEKFWVKISPFLASSKNKLVGFNVKNFDLPFLIRRSWINGVKVPFGLMEGRYWNRCIIDVMELWGCGSYNYMISLDKVAKVLGVGSKDPEIGKNFQEFWRKDIHKAMKYLENDLILTKAIFDKLYSFKAEPSIDELINLQ